MQLVRVTTHTSIKRAQKEAHIHSTQAKRYATHLQPMNNTLGISLARIDFGSGGHQPIIHLPICDKDPVPPRRLSQSRARHVKPQKLTHHEGAYAWQRFHFTQYQRNVNAIENVLAFGALGR